MEATGTGIVLDVTDQESIKPTLKNIKEKYGPINILVNNAGITDDALTLRMSGDKFRRVIDTNLNAVFDMSKACLPDIMKTSGRIINIASVVAAAGNPGQANYAAAKGGVLGMTRVLADEVGSRGATVNSVLPGFIKSDMTKDLPQEVKDRMNAQIPLQKMGTPENIADVVGFLASDAAEYITGAALHVNGGMYKSQ